MYEITSRQHLCSLRGDELLDVVDELFSHHDDQQLLGQLNETSTRSTLSKKKNGSSVEIDSRFPAKMKQPVAVIKFHFYLILAASSSSP